jgi:hypothetical protein
MAGRQAPGGRRAEGFERPGGPEIKSPTGAAQALPGGKNWGSIQRGPPKGDTFPKQGAEALAGQSSTGRGPTEGIPKIIWVGLQF